MLECFSLVRLPVNLYYCLYAGIEVSLVRINNKAHSMISGEEEMRTVMAFWAKHLKSSAPEALEGETIVEVEPGTLC